MGRAVGAGVLVGASPMVTVWPMLGHEKSDFPTLRPASKRSVFSESTGVNAFEQSMSLQMRWIRLTRSDVPNPGHEFP